MFCQFPWTRLSIYYIQPIQVLPRDNCSNLVNYKFVRTMKMTEAIWSGIFSKKVRLKNYNAEQSKAVAEVKLKNSNAEQSKVVA